MTLPQTVLRANRREWGPSKPKISRADVLARLADTSITLRELAVDLGYSRNWLQTIASMHEIVRPRGGDRRSPAARARYGA